MIGPDHADFWYTRRIVAVPPPLFRVMSSCNRSPLSHREYNMKASAMATATMRASPSQYAFAVPGAFSGPNDPWNGVPKTNSLLSGFFGPAMTITNLSSSFWISNFGTKPFILVFAAFRIAQPKPATLRNSSKPSQVPGTISQLPVRSGRGASVGAVDGTGLGASGQRSAASASEGTAAAVTCPEWGSAGAPSRD